MADINITISIASANVADLKAGLLKARPKADPGQSDLNYLKELIENSLFNIYKTGKIMIAKEATAPVINDTIVSVT